MPHTARSILLGVAVIAGASACGYPDPPPNPEIKPAPIGSPDWKVTRRYSVNRVMIIEGEASDVERALEIAKSEISPSAEAYDEVLVFVRPPDQSRTRRVQWTKAGGYKVLDY